MAPRAAVDAAERSVPATSQQSNAKLNQAHTQQQHQPTVPYTSWHHVHYSTVKVNKT